MTLSGDREEEEEGEDVIFKSKYICFGIRGTRFLHCSDLHAESPCLACT